MTELDAARQVQAKEYARRRRRLWLAGTMLGAIYAVAWLALGWADAVRDWLARVVAGTDALQVAGIGAIYFGLYYLLQLPLTYYGGFLLPHQFGQSTRTLTGWMADQIRGVSVDVPIGLLLLELLYAALRLAGDLWWLWAAGGMLVFSVLLSNLAPVLIMPLFNKYTPLGEEHQDLASTLMRLAERAGTRVRGVYKFDMSRRTRAANAALTGLGNTRRIVLGDTLIREFSTDEIETILAHELGHHVHRDIPLLIGFGAVTTTVGLFLVGATFAWIRQALNLGGLSDVANLPALMLLFGAFGLLGMPVENAFSRWREGLADQYALDSTGKPAAFASALTRLANQNLGEVNPEKWIVWLFYSHPPLGQRISRANRSVV